MKKDNIKKEEIINPILSLSEQTILKKFGWLYVPGLLYRTEFPELKITNFKHIKLISEQCILQNKINEEIKLKLELERKREKEFAIKVLSVMGFIIVTLLFILF